jgi:hypothetical protein
MTVKSFQPEGEPILVELLSFDEISTVDTVGLEITVKETALHLWLHIFGYRDFVSDFVRHFVRPYSTTFLR